MKIQVGDIVGLMGQRFGRLKPIKYMGKDKRRQPFWLCECDCGTEIIVNGYSLKYGHTKSCGCLYKEGNNLKHGHSKRKGRSRTYKIWEGIIQRCTNPNHKHYRHYGGRGIIVCDRWLRFENFLEDIGEIPKNKEIDRINNDGNYSVKNCKLSTRKEQCRNKRNNHLIPYDGKNLTIAEWSEVTGINNSTIRKRIKLGWSIENILTTPVKKRDQNENTSSIKR